MATTKITNTSGVDRFFGFIPPHGATILAGDDLTIDGDIRSILASGNGRHTRKRELDSLNAAEVAREIAILQNAEDDTPNPTFVSITPNSGTDAGGTAVTIVGTGFAPDATVTIGGAAATSIVVVSTTTITCVTPAGTAGARDVVITNGDGGTVTGTGEYTYT